MKKSNVITDIYSSVFNLKDYARFAKEKTSRTILYILLISILLSGIVIYKPFVELKAYLGFLNTHKVIENLPDFKFENGILKADQEKPLVASDDGMIFILDPHMTDASIDEEFLFYETGVILTDDAAYLRFGNSITGFSYDFEFPVGGLKLSTVDTTSLYDAIYILASSPLLLALPWFISILVSNLMFIFMVAVMVSLFISRNLIKFSEVFKLAAHACTLSLFFKTLEMSMFIPTSLNYFLTFSIAYIYANNGIKLFVKEKKLKTK